LIQTFSQTTDMQTFTILACLLGVTLASYDAGQGYMDMDQLYRMQLLANAFGMEDYIPEDQPVDSRAIRDDYWPEMEAAEPTDDNSVYNDRFYSGAHLRDEEHLEQSALHGYQSVSGGAGEVAPNPAQEVKSDKQLPEYCNPPNPCPVGKTAKDNCVENFENSAENNEHLLKEQECPCDTEHMFSCPAGSETVSSKAQNSGSQQMALNKVLDDLAKIEQGNGALENNKRLKIVSKKSPGHVIHKRSEATRHGNPYLQGAPVAIAAKKDPNMRTVFRGFEDQN